ncbi:MAG TPA: serine/threonine protein kinase, partial [Myxococcales bacterium]|nr:serine/threonine protein kinase [Myxococcales bacterium]
MAEVYKARVLEGPRAGQMVAVKRLTPRLATDPE